ncbi:AbrB/MazE/SpoVT family DNA-binding domain-containing protein [Vulcanisaeta thermophila]|uniref:AbrB/MazE/SpoVT family DNA-binding domain-containing protein n=1 Tax=Vulcanisaeta thermophila TaxID=867917 RepID=UPI001EE1B84A|nr:AbrB/MazE/SpoVT family DNA-binding domain-containing protein [Vulcanisaeta thermophila]
MTKGVRLKVDSLPYQVKVYVNNQVLLPASLVRALNLGGVDYVDITLEFNNKVIELRNVKLLHARNAVSRQFTIPREVREQYGIKPLDTVTILSIKPSGPRTQ